MSYTPSPTNINFGDPVGVTTSEEYIEFRNNVFNKCGQFNYYDALELTPRCTQNDIKKQYYKLARLLHPDKNSAIDLTEAMSYITTAYDILSDECLRAYYDYENNLYIGGEAGRLSCIERVKHAVVNKRETYTSKKLESYWNDVANKWDTGGLIIKKALYGNLSNLENSIDVTIALQALIEDDQLCINHNELESFHKLPGFYTEIHDTHDTLLYILYIYKRSVYETTVANYSRLYLPLEKHKVYFGYVRGPGHHLFDLFPKNKLEVRIKIANLISGLASPYITALTLALGLFTLHKKLKS